MIIGIMIQRFKIKKAPVQFERGAFYLVSLCTL